MVESTSSPDVIFRAHHGRIFSLCYLLLADRQEARDVAQEVFCKMLKTYGENQQIRSWEAWLTRVAINACRDRKRSAWWIWQRDHFEELEEETLRSQTLSPEDSILQREALEHPYRLIEALSARQREVFVLRRLDGWSNDEVATLLGLTTGSVKRHLFHAIRHLQKGLGAQA